MSNTLVHPRAVVDFAWHLTNVVLGYTVRQVGFEMVLPVHKLEQQGVLMPLILLPAAVLLLNPERSASWARHVN